MNVPSQSSLACRRLVNLDIVTSDEGTLPCR
jgi:hypothetical protein